ncbi:MAG: hypothetical protein MUC91_14440 [Verrucomicrobia bacterium]|nr:hypothetical protein [Verrucomicrobiota bacterium]
MTTWTSRLLAGLLVATRTLAAAPPDSPADPLDLSRWKLTLVKVHSGQTDLIGQIFDCSGKVHPDVLFIVRDEFRHLQCQAPGTEACKADLHPTDEGGRPLQSAIPSRIPSFPCKAS